VLIHLAIYNAGFFSLVNLVSKDIITVVPN